MLNKEYRSANEVLEEIQNLKGNIEMLLRIFIEHSKRENNEGYIYGLDSDMFINYKERIKQLEEELKFLNEYLPETFDGALRTLERLDGHSCQYEDGYCIICGRDGYA